MNGVPERCPLRISEWRKTRRNQAMVRYATGGTQNIGSNEIIDNRHVLNRIKEVPDMNSLPPGSPVFRKGHFLAAASGIFLFLCFFGLTQTYSRLFISFHPPFSNSSLGETYLWLGSLLFLFPAACLIGYGTGPWLGPRLARSWKSLEEMSCKDQVNILIT